MTKSYYREILEKALVQAKLYYDKSPNVSINVSFYNQLLDIKRTVIDEGQIYAQEEGSKKYPLGIMAIRNFDGEEFDYKDMLVDVAYGISRYSSMPEGNNKPSTSNNQPPKPKGGWTVFDGLEEQF